MDTTKDAYMISHNARHTPSRIRGSDEDMFERKRGTISPSMRSPNFLQSSPMVLAAVCWDYVSLEIAGIKTERTSCDSSLSLTRRRTSCETSSGNNSRTRVYALGKRNGRVDIDIPVLGVLCTNAFQMWMAD